MSCNCHEQHKNLNTWGCGCNKMPEEPKRKGAVKFCDVCDPCAPQESNVRLCAFVVPTLEEGRYFRNSFIFVQEDDSVYYISDDRSEIPFGSRPKFIEHFNPATALKNTVVYDTANKAAYVYDGKGTRMELAVVENLEERLSALEARIAAIEGGE